MYRETVNRVRAARGPIAAALAGLLAAGARAAEAQASAPTVLYAFYVPSGTVYRIKEPGLPDACHSQAT